MADSENTPTQGEGNILRAQIRSSVVEAITGIEAITHGLEAITRKPESVPIREDLEVVRKMADQAAELLDAVKAALAEGQ